MESRDRPPYRKRLGQHHLVDPALCRPLIDFLSPTGRTVLEVGPGAGALTLALTAAGARVVALELDSAWAFSLVGQGGPGAIRLLVGDALDFEWSRLPDGWQVAGNLPYNVATPLVQRVLASRRPGDRMAFLVQHEVALRLTAGSGSKDYGALTVLVAARAEAYALGRVKAASFRPPPKVDGQFVGLVARPPAVAEGEMAAFTRLVRAAFSRRRKTLRNALGSFRPRSEVELALAAAEIDAGERAERLSLEDFVRLHHAFAS